MTSTAQARIAILVAALLASAIVAAGYFVGAGPANFKAAKRTVTVRGLADKEVVADFVIWTLNVQRAGSDIKSVQSDAKRDRDTLMQFLQKQGLSESDIERLPISSQDRQATHLALVTTGREPTARYVAYATVVVRSRKVDVVRAALGAMDELIVAGVLLGGRDDGRSNVVYRFTKFNDLRPELISAATANARASAERFAQDSSKKVGPIRSAQQGLIQIFGEEGIDESAGYAATSYRKKIRVVNTIEFDLVD